MEESNRSRQGLVAKTSTAMDEIPEGDNDVYVADISDKSQDKNEIGPIGDL